MCKTYPGLCQPLWVHASWAPSCSSVIYCAICKLIFFPFWAHRRASVFPNTFAPLKLTHSVLLPLVSASRPRLSYFWACFQENNLLFVVRSVKLSGMIFFFRDAGQVNPKKAEDLKPCLQRWLTAGLILSIKIKRSSQIASSWTSQGPQWSGSRQ